MRHILNFTITTLADGKDGMGHRGGFHKDVMDPEAANKVHEEALNDLIAGRICDLSVTFHYRNIETKQ